MNKQQLEQHWEACRDGTISDADRAALETYLRDHPGAAAMWQAESQWLQMLSDVDGAFEEEAETSASTCTHSCSSGTFVAGVLEQWQASQEREALGVGGDIVARIGPDGMNDMDDSHVAFRPGSRQRMGRYIASFAGLAAAIALVVIAALYGNMLNNQNTSPGPVAGTMPNTMAAALSPAAAPDAPDAIGLLFASAKEGYSLAAASPARIKQGFSSTTAFLDVSTLTKLLDPNLPDPADFVEPRAGG